MRWYGPSDEIYTSGTLVIAWIILFLLCVPKERPRRPQRPELNPLPSHRGDLQAPIEEMP